MWRDIAVKYLVGTNSILHTDSAKAYLLSIEGLHTKKVPETSIVHQVKKVDGKWVQPTYASMVLVDIGLGYTILVHKGTQYVDGYWQHMRSEIGYSNKINEDLCLSKLRMSQWKRWSQ
eukprot:423854-Amphidinium_carterae.1